VTPEGALAALARLDDPAVRALVGAPGALRLRRAWPRGPGHLLLEYATPAGGRLAGQWFGPAEDVGRLERVALATRRAASHAGDVLALPDRGLLLQARGADRALPGLAALAAVARRLVVHRPERRAVLELDGRFVKVVRREAGTRVATAGAVAADLPFAVPALVAREGVVTVWSVLRGRPLHDLLGAPDTPRRAPAVGRAVRALHGAPVPRAAARHDAGAEVDVLDTWLDRLRPFDPALTAALAPSRDRVAAALLDGSAARGAVLVHRDLHDKQLFLDGDVVGLLDFDTLAAGEAALDLANLLVHLELRALQGRCTPARAAELAAAVLEGYQPDRAVRDRLAAYAAATRLRLCAVYRFRPGAGAAVAALREGLFAPPLGLLSPPAPV